MKRARHSTDPDQAIADALDRLREELAVVREVLAEIQEELQWANRNRPDGSDPPNLLRPVTSMPIDPMAHDWAQRLNRFSAADLPAQDVGPSSAEPGRLF